MSHECKFLSRDSLPQLYRSFCEAFSDYVLDMSHVTEEKFLSRVTKNGISLESSVGAFDGNKMVGFTMVGLDEFDGVSSAFDIGTGIIKAYRGRGIAREMFDFATPRLREQGVRRFVLEVIQTNEPAVRAYKRAGFKVVREFDCLELMPGDARCDRGGRPPVTVMPVERDELPSFSSFLDWRPSWENSFSSIRRIPDEVLLLGAVHESERIGLAVHYLASNWIMCLAVRRDFRRRGVATELLRHLLDGLTETASAVKLVNVERSDAAMLSFAEKVGFKLFARQFEMSLELLP
ncbi:MAG: GNAT family N-acetyltransferase [Candidatus Eiseniibacteriota bacterium]|nr:MAG: GNAT family N-acetyltransferase [Candidatus Eisenbacteria bacterium]